VIGVPRQGHLLNALSQRGFRRLYAARLLGQFGDGVFQASLAGAVLFNPERQAHAGDVAAGFAALLVPYSLVGPFAGVLLDRWRRQRVLVVSNVLRALGVLVIGVTDSTPAARAGLEEGNRIAAINGVNLRVAREDAGDRWVGSARAERLQRENLHRGVEVRVEPDQRDAERSAELGCESQLLLQPDHRVGGGQEAADRHRREAERDVLAHLAFLGAVLQGHDQLAAEGGAQ